MKAKEVRDLTTMELELKLKDAKQVLLHLRFQHATNQLDNPMKLVEVKKTIARIMTIIHERELTEKVNV